MPIPEIHTRDSLHFTTEHRYDSIYIDRHHTISLLPGLPQETKTTEWGQSLIGSFRIDTMVVRDSIYIEKWRIRDHTDTIRITQRDSIPYEVEVPKYIRQRNWYDRATSWGFWLLFIGILLFVIGRVSCAG